MELFLLKDILKQSIEEKKIYCFYEYSNSSFYCGYVLSYNNDTIQIRHYDKFGQSDGSLNLSYSNIRRIAISGTYIDKIKYLIEHQDDLRKLSDLSNFIPAPTSEGFLPILKHCLNDRNLILNIETSKESYIGFVEDIIGDSNLIFTEIDNDGNIFETALHKIDDVESISINDRQSLRFLLLYRWRKSLK